MTTEELIKIGFEVIPHFTVTNAHIYKLGRHRHLSIGCAGTPNEMMFICSTDDKDERKITDLICLHNYDYDGYMTIEYVENVIKSIKSKLNKNES